MRLEAQSKAGFYPADPAAVAMAIAMLDDPPHDKPLAILDPCAGEGKAIGQIALHLRSRDARTLRLYAIELEEGRGHTAKEYLGNNDPDVNVLQPCSFQGAAISPNSFSFAWVNPPFDDVIGGGSRVEYMFLQRATQLLRPGGIIMLVLPESALRNDMPRYFLQNYERLSVTPFPADCRPFEEVVVAGVKRQQPVDDDGSWWGFIEDHKAPQRYRLPAAVGPHRFQKCDFTPDELKAALAESPLRKFLEPPPEIPLSEPPLPLASGHIALMLASGTLDGRVEFRDEEPHVVRGTAHKREYVQEESEEIKDDGTVVTKTILSEKIELCIRAVGKDGVIKTFTDGESA